MRILLLLTLTAVAGVGCTSTNITRLVHELKDDPATVTVNVGTVYGTVRFVRTSPEPGQTVAIAPDGTVTIKR